jgi:DNA invertase Pin-like site-specific DNA recombinase
MDRPALKTLLERVREKRIDVVVVYKVDRLTRSLADFAKIVEIFDAHGVSFVAVTQQFHTTTSMGRLTLNVLLSFAQFEREVTGERIRDKIAASKQKGMWMGGTPPLGYDLRDRHLVVNKAEAETVRLIFRLYIELKTLRRVREELDLKSVLSKQWASRGGVRHGGYVFGRGSLYHLLASPIYVGDPAQECYLPGPASSDSRKSDLGPSSGDAELRKPLTRADKQSGRAAACSWANYSMRAASRCIPAGRRRDSGAIVISSRRDWSREPRSRITVFGACR